MEIQNPRRILAVSLADSAQHLSQIIKDLTGTHPSPASTTLAGTTHTLPLKTQYYTAEVSIWLDLIESPAEWAASFLSAEAKEVLAVLGGVAVVFELPRPGEATEAETRELLREVGKVVRDGLGGWSWDGVSLAVGVGEGEAEEWEDVCADHGLEFVQVKSGKMDDARNEFGEKTGISRVLEALETNEWAQLDTGASDDDSDFGDFEKGSSSSRPTGNATKTTTSEKPDEDKEESDDEFDPRTLDFGFDARDFEGLRRAIQEAGQTEDDEDEGDRLDEEEVEKLGAMMQKLQAVRDMSAGLPDDERRRMAKRAVGEVMKEL